MTYEELDDACTLVQSLPVPWTDKGPKKEDIIVAAEEARQKMIDLALHPAWTEDQAIFQAKARVGQIALEQYLPFHKLCLISSAFTYARTISSASRLLSHPTSSSPTPNPTKCAESCLYLKDRPIQTVPEARRCLQLTLSDWVRKRRMGVGQGRKEESGLLSARDERE